MSDSKVVKELCEEHVAETEELLSREAARELKAGLHEQLPKLSPRGQDALLKPTRALLGVE